MTLATMLIQMTVYIIMLYISYYIIRNLNFKWMPYLFNMYRLIAFVLIVNEQRVEGFGFISFVFSIVTYECIIRTVSLGIYKTDLKFSEFLSRSQSLQINYYFLESFEAWPLEAIQNLIDEMALVDKYFHIKKKRKTLGRVKQEDGGFIINILVWGNEYTVHHRLKTKEIVQR